MGTTAAEGNDEGGFVSGLWNTAAYLAVPLIGESGTVFPIGQCGCDVVGPLPELSGCCQSRGDVMGPRGPAQEP